MPTLPKARRILYICDNAGEIVFDRFFVETIARHRPDLAITCTVQQTPIINDAVMADALYAGFDDDATVVVSSGSVYPGTIPEESSETFRELYDGADMIIAKGEGNFETLLGKPVHPATNTQYTHCNNHPSIRHMRNRT
ncbi:ARMT1-like domain-containing protein [Chlorobium sp. N1]|uniref:ARMT1-like domain-containing protein n=1 Tax=Chlorobium sp. N1 TaxID=2491138 RepID=UPI001F61641B|nr:ARMT1-like domain-containing protein [Chlorobium sp. N1]